jgi:membrane protease YdiL (CAAX protease family)
VTWELFFRGFLLFGLREVLRAGGRDGADTIAILVTASFEVLYHFIKPSPLEACGMLLGSPILSYVALRHGSVWIPLLGHVWIEYLWFMAVWR